MKRVGGSGSGPREQSVSVSDPLLLVLTWTDELLLCNLTNNIWVLDTNMGVRDGKMR